MNILKAPAGELLQLLQALASVVERRHAMPVLSQVLISKAGEQLAFTTSDLELQLRLETALGAGSGHGQATAPVLKLLDILKALPPEQEAVLTSTPQRLSLAAGRSRFTLQSLPAGDFPLQAPAHDLEDGFSLPPALLRQLLEQVDFAMAVQDIRYYLNGLLLHTEGQQLRLVATDGNRLAVAEATLDHGLPTHSAILPRKTVHALQRHLRTPRSAGGAAEPQVQVRLAPQQACFQMPGATLLSKLVEGRFPDYTRVLPQHPRQRLQLDRAELLAALQRVAVLTNERFRGVRLHIEGGLLQLSAENGEQEAAEVELAVLGQAPDDAPLNFGFNLVYLVDVLSRSHAAQVRLAVVDDRSPVLFTFDDRPGFQYVVSPMRL